jgi:hypothetical protein
MQIRWLKEERTSFRLTLPIGARTEKIVPAAGETADAG